MTYVPLHVHTSYSLLDGGIKIKEYVAKAKKYGMPAVALTDHGNMSGFVKLYKECKAQEIKPIIGTEFYVDPNGMSARLLTKPYHLILLAMNNQGLNNLIALNTLAHQEGFYYKPRVDWGAIVEYHEGLICASACVAGELGKCIMCGESAAFWETLNFYHSLFGDRFYLELQNNTMPEQKAINSVLKQACREEVNQLADIPLVMTTDAHYLNQADAEVHDILLCIQTGKKIADPDRMRFPTDDFFVMTPEEMYARAQDDQEREAVANTVKVAERCSIELTLGINRMPVYDVTKDKDYTEYLESRGQYV